MRSTRVADENQLEWHKARKLPANKSLREEVNSSEEASIAKIKVQWTGGKPQRHRDQTTRLPMVDHNGDKKCPTPFYIED